MFEPLLLGLLFFQLLADPHCLYSPFSFLVYMTLVLAFFLFPSPCCSASTTFDQTPLPWKTAISSPPLW